MNNTLKIAVAITLLVVIVGGGVFGYLYMKTIDAIQIAEAKAELADYKSIYEPLGELITCYTVESDQPYGRKIDIGDLIPIEIPAACAVNVFTEEADLIGKYYRVNVTEGTILTYDLIMEFPQAADERAYDVITAFNPIGLKENDFVDIRINMPMGEDYIALSHKRVEGVYGGVLKLVMSEYDITVYNSLVVDSMLFQGSIIYATKYLEPGSQSAAKDFYPMSPSVLSIAMKNPNIAKTINYEEMISRRKELEEAFGFINENELLKALLEAGKNVIPTKIQNGEDAYQTQLAIEEQKRLEAELSGR